MESLINAKHGKNLLPTPILIAYEQKDQEYPLCKSQELIVKLGQHWVQHLHLQKACFSLQQNVFQLLLGPVEIEYIKFHGFQRMKKK